MPTPEGKKKLALPKFSGALIPIKCIPLPTMAAVEGKKDGASLNRIIPIPHYLVPRKLTPFAMNQEENGVYYYVTPEAQPQSAAGPNIWIPRMA